MKVAVIGASGWIGGEVVRELERRGHDVTAVGRDEARLAGIGSRQIALDATDAGALVGGLLGHDAVVSSVTDRSTADRSAIPRTVRALIEAMPRVGIYRLVVVGGGGSLQAAPGTRFVDLPGFPEEYRAEALAQAEALDLLQRTGGDLDWSYFSPPPANFVPAERTGAYHAEAGDLPVVDADGEARLGSGDFASALVDELEQPRFGGQRFTAGAR